MAVNFRLPPIQLSEILFAHNGILGKDIQILKAGKFIHDQEELEIKTSDLAMMVGNFERKVRGIDLMLDFSHESEGKAAAWFTRLYTTNEDSELWAEVNWTACGTDAVKGREFRYISADFNFNYQDNESLQEYGPTLFGAALTNRPVIKRMVPTILSEGKEPITNNKEIKMPTIEELTAKNAELQAKLDLQLAKTAEVETKNAELVTLSEKTKADVKLAEEKVKADAKLSEKKVKFDTKLSEGLVCEAQRNDFMDDNMEGFMEKAVAIQTKTNGNNSTQEKEVSNETASAQLVVLAEKKSKEKGISLGEGMKLALRENKELSDKYIKETSV